MPPASSPVFRFGLTIGPLLEPSKHPLRLPKCLQQNEHAARKFATLLRCILSSYIPPFKVPTLQILVSPLKNLASQVQINLLFHRRLPDRRRVCFKIRVLTQDLYVASTPTRKVLIQRSRSPCSDSKSIHVFQRFSAYESGCCDAPSANMARAREEFACSTKEFDNAAAQHVKQANHGSILHKVSPVDVRVFKRGRTGHWMHSVYVMRRSPAHSKVMRVMRILCCIAIFLWIQRLEIHLPHARSARVCTTGLSAVQTPAP